MFVCLSVGLPVCLSACLPACLSVCLSLSLSLRCLISANLFLSLFFYQAKANVANHNPKPAVTTNDVSSDVADGAAKRAFDRINGHSSFAKFGLSLIHI